ncbi:hypothetical protein ACA910_012644 [Epithemia clementina (nom. ined.)]
MQCVSTKAWECLNASRRCNLLIASRRTPSFRSLLIRPSSLSVNNLLNPGRYGSSSPHQQRKNKTQSTSSALVNSTDHKNNPQSLRALSERINTIYLEKRDLPELPAIWERNEAVTNGTTDRRQKIFQDVLSFLDDIYAAVDRGLFQQNSAELSTFLDKALRILSVSEPPGDSSESIYDHCARIISLLQSLNINVQHSHCESVMLVAAREGRWKEAAELYSSRIDPAGGTFFNPVTISVKNPVGLYCIARYAQETGKSAVDSVLNAVQHMSIGSSSDQECYVLAAGTALGYAGESDQMLQYVRTSLNAKQLGQPLIAATMHACLLCNRPNDALQLFDNLTSGEHHASVQWQWAGGQGKLLPACRDLALRALGASRDTNTSGEALKYFQQTEEEGWTLSYEAFLGVLLSCEKDQEWEKAVDVLFAVLQKQMENPMLRDGSSLEIPQMQASSTTNNHTENANENLTRALEVVMRTCNASRRFGVSLICAQRFADCFPNDSFGRLLEGLEKEEMPSISSISQLLASIAFASSSPRELFTTAFASLCGANCFDASQELLMKMNSSSQNDVLFSDFADLHKYNEWEQPDDDYSETWDQIVVSLKLLMDVKKLGASLSKDDRKYFSFACSRLLRDISAVECQNVGFTFIRWLLDLNPSYIGSARSTESLLAVISGSSLLELSDSLLASFMLAAAQDKGPYAALHLYKDSSLADQTGWVLSSTVAVDELFKAKEKEKALQLFESVLARTRNPDLFLVAARNLFELGDNRGVITVYKRALSSGCISESLSLLAIDSISRLRSHGKLRLMQDIAQEAAHLTGDKAASLWAGKHYWDLKKRISIDELSRILAWHERETVYLDELQLALEVVNDRSRHGFAPHIESLETIAFAASGYHSDFVPKDRTRIHLVPRNPEDWFKTIQQTLKLAEQTRLYHDSRFMSNMSMALARLGYIDEFIDLVEKCLERGIPLERHVLDAAGKSAPHNQALVQAKDAFYPNST